MAAEIGVAKRAEDQHRPGAGGAQQEAREQQGPSIGPMEVVDHEQQWGARGEVRECRVNGVEQAVPRAGVAGVAGLQRLSGAGLGQRLGKRLERRQGLLGAAADQDGCVFGESG